MAARQAPRFDKHMPVPQGPHVVGCVDIMIGRTKEGTLMRLFYPCRVTDLEAEANNWTLWFLGEEYSRGVARGMAAYIGIPSIHSLISMYYNWKMRNVATPAVWEAGLLRSQQWPVVVFSHSHGGKRTTNSTVCSEIASHGFVVAAVEHRDGSACASFILHEEGRREYITHELRVHDFWPLDTKSYRMRNRQVKVRVEESIRALDALHQLNEGQAKNELQSTFDLQQLCGTLDLSCPIMSGQSFGGVTVITTLARDKRFKIGVSLDPWMFPIKDEVEDACGSVSQPLICICSEAFQFDLNLQAMSSLPSESTTFVTIKGTVHQSQNDNAFLWGNIERRLLGMYSSLDAHTAMDINNRLMLNFLARHLGDRAASMNNYACYLETQQQNLVYGLEGKGKSMLDQNASNHTV